MSRSEPSSEATEVRVSKGRRLAAIGAVLAIAALVAACGGGGAATIGSGGLKVATGPVVHGGTATMAWVAATPNFIFPLPPATNEDGYNANLTLGLWPSLAYIGDGGQSIVNPQESLFSSLRYSDADKVITMVLKPWKWSDGVPITSRDFTFTYDLLKAEYSDWINYVQGTFPTDVTGVLTPNAHTVVIDLNRSYNPAFYTDDVLSEIPLLPQHAWDKTSASGKVGNMDETTAGAKAVWGFLQTEGGDIATFASNPLWQVVDGPWKLAKFVSGDGYYAWVPNKNYSGPDKPLLSEYVAEPFTSDTAELDTLRSGISLDVAQLPLNDIGQLGTIESEGYSVAQQAVPGVAAIIPNLDNASVGPLLRQLYIRQALEDLIDRKQIVAKVYDGYADPGNGPVPLSSGQWVSPLEKTGGPYPYSPSAAIAVLKAHGLTVVPNGVSTCLRPGSGAADCGAGIRTGEPLALQLLYSSGSTPYDQQSAAIQSSEDLAGVKVTLKSEPFNTLTATVGTCTASKHPASTCGWQLVYFGYDLVSLYPSSDGFFDTGGVNNQGGYSNPEMDTLINETKYSSSASAFYAYEDYAARQLPWLWLPQETDINVYKSNLAGFTPVNPFSGSLNPEVWYYAKHGS